MGKKLGLHLIFKNELLYLEDAIRSVISIVDECVLVDSGSTDGSEQIVFKLQNEFPTKKLRYFRRNWPGSFSDQRNFALEQAETEWILFLDADERILEKDHFKLLGALENSDVMAYEIPIINYTYDTSELDYQPGNPQVKDGPYSYGYVLTKLHRLFRKDERIRYSGALHERIEPSLFQNKLKVAPLDVPIQHLGRLKEKDLQLESERYAFYEILGRKKIQESPNDAQAFWELGVILLKQSRFDEALRLFEKAAELAPDVEEFQVYQALTLFKKSAWSELLQLKSKFEKVQFFSVLARAQTDPQAIDALDNFRKYFSQVALFTFELSLRHKRADRLERDRKEAGKIFEKTGLIEFLEGSHFRYEKKWNEAVQLLRKSFDKKCDLAIHELALALSQAGKLDEALHFFEKLNEKQKSCLRMDTRKVFAYAAQTLGQNPQRYLEAASPVLT